MADFPIDADGVEQRSIDLSACEPNIDDLRGRLDSIVRYFCPNPGCIQSFCQRHGMFLFGLTTCWFSRADLFSIGIPSCSTNRASSSQL